MKIIIIQIFNISASIIIYYSSPNKEGGCQNKCISYIVVHCNVLNCDVDHALESLVVTNLFS